MTIARVLVADAGIPSAGQGSWSQRIEYLLQQYKDNRFDYLISEFTEEPFHSAVTKRFNCKQYKNRLLNKLWPAYRYRKYTQAINRIAPNHDMIIICILDSLRVKSAVWQHIKAKGLQQKTKLIYYQCGFSKYLPANIYEQFIEGIDECIYLTRNAYRYELENNPSMPFPVNILHNPVNHFVFYPPSPSEKQQLRHELKMDSNIQFIWASYDRPKKGLAVILEAWQRFYTNDNPVVLHIVGASRDVTIPGVLFHGKVSNKEIHRWFKAADIGVFSSLWTEGFGLSLAEQISCGLFCIASTAGGVKDYFKDGEHGIAIDDPNMTELWVQAFENALLQLDSFRISKKDKPSNSLPFLTYDEWCERFQTVFDNMEKRLQYRGKK